MVQLLRRLFHWKHGWHVPVAARSLAFAVVVVAALLAIKVAITTTTNVSSHSTKLPLITIKVFSRLDAVPTAAKSPVIIPVKVTAYTLEGTMADGKKARAGACAVSTDQFPLGSIILFYNADGSFNRLCVAEDTGDGVRYGQIDLAMPGDEDGATRWGIRSMSVRVLRWGWGEGGSPSSLPIRKEFR